jgi:hypothetical protein
MGDPAKPEISPEARREKQRLLILRFLFRSARETAWRALKNRIKILIGRKPYFDERGLFLRQYILHVTGLRPIRKITCIGYKTEGPGSQAIVAMQAINFARCAGLTYAHTPFSLIQHADRPMKEWAAAWEALFNFGAGEAVCEAERREAVSYSHNFPELELCLGWSGRGEELHQSFKSMVPEFRRKYYLNKSRRTTEGVTIAVHLRRGWDVPGNPHLYSSTGPILRTIKLVKEWLDAQHVPHKISIYSEGSSKDFAEVSIPGVELSNYRVGHHPDRALEDGAEESFRRGGSFIDIDAVAALRELIEADVLIMSKSSFSYCAGIISEGIKLFEELQDMPPMDEWIVRLPDGSFDRAEFERQLSLLMLEKGLRETSAADPGDTSS